MTKNPPLGCEVVYYERATDAQQPLTVHAKRGTSDVDVTGAITTSTTQLEVFYGNYDCDGSVIEQYTRLEDYKISRIALSGAQVGDELSLGYQSIGTVTAAGACVEDTSQVQPTCTATNSGYPCTPPHGDAGVDDDNDGTSGGGGGCSAAGSAGLALVALFAHLLRRRRS